MRDKMASTDGERRRFRGIFVRTGKKINFKGHSEDTILLSKIFDITENRIVTDHLWFNYTSSFAALQLKEGDILEFDARVKKYKKGYVNKRIQVNNQTVDYKLSHPTKISIVKHS